MADDPKNDDVTPREAFEHTVRAVVTGTVEVMRQVLGVGDNAPLMALTAASWTAPSSPSFLTFVRAIHEAARQPR